MADKLHSRLQGRAGWHESKINMEGEEEMFKKNFFFLPLHSCSTASHMIDVLPHSDGVNLKWVKRM